MIEYYLKDEEMKHVVVNNMNIRRFALKPALQLHNSDQSVVMVGVKEVTN